MRKTISLIILLLPLVTAAQGIIIINFEDNGKYTFQKSDATTKPLVPFEGYDAEATGKLNRVEGFEIKFIGKVPEDLVVTLNGDKKELKENTDFYTAKDDQRRYKIITVKRDPTIVMYLLKFKSNHIKPGSSVLTNIGIKQGAEMNLNMNNDNKKTTTKTPSYTNESLGVNCDCIRELHDDLYITKLLNNAIPKELDGSDMVKMARISSDSTLTIVQKNDQISELRYVQSSSSCLNCESEDMLIYDASCQSLFYRPYDGKVKRIFNYRDIKFRFNHGLRVKIINVNRFLVDAKVESDVLVYDSQPSALFSNIFGSGTYMNKLIGNMSLYSDTPFKSLGTDLETFVNRLIKLQDRRMKIYNPCCIPTWGCGTEIEQFDDMIPMLGDLTRRYNATLTEYKKKAENLANTNIILAAAQKKLKDLEAEKNPKDPAAQKKAINAAKAEVNAQDAEQYSGADKDLADLQNIWALYHLPTEQQLFELIVFNYNFVRGSYTYTTPPIPLTGNRLQVKISLSTRDTSFVLQKNLGLPVKQELQVEGPIIGQWITSFSTGPFFGLTSNLYATRYEVIRQPQYGNVVTDSSLYVVKPAGNTNRPIGLAGLAHFQLKGNGYGIGGTIGAGLTAESTPKITYLAGVSGFFGNKSQFAITAGAMGMQVDVLKADLYTSVYRTPPTLQYGKEFRIGAFLSLTYTIFTINKKDSAPAAGSGGSTSSTPAK